MITPEDWKDWKANKVTQEFLKHVYNTREDYKEALAEGKLEDNVGQDIVIGRCQGIKDCIEFAVTWNGLFSGDNQND